MCAATLLTGATQIPSSVDGTDLSGVFDDPSRTDLKEAAFVEAAVCKRKGNGTLWGNDACPEGGWEGFMGCAPPPPPPRSDLPRSLTPHPAPRTTTRSHASQRRIFSVPPPTHACATPDASLCHPRRLCHPLEPPPPTPSSFT